MTTLRPTTLTHALCPLLVLGLAACGKSASTAESIVTTRPYVAASETASDRPVVPEARAQPLEPQTPPLEELEVAPEPGPSWSLVANTEARAELSDLSLGVLVRVGDQRFTRAEAGELIEAPAKSKSTQIVTGSWPDNAWKVRMLSGERAGLSIQMSKWKSNKRWVAQPIKDVPEDLMWGDDGKWYEMGGAYWGHAGGRGGYLLAVYDEAEERLVFRRLAGENFAPVDMPWSEEKSGWPLEVHESPSGRVFVFAEQEDNRVEVTERARCRQSCKSQTTELPASLAGGLFEGAVSRGEDDLSVGVRSSWDSPAPTRLLHRDAGTWTVDDAPVEGASFGRMIEGVEGGLFVVIETGEREQLWHRDGAGEWEPVELPEAFADAGPTGGKLELDVARAEVQTLWLALNTSEAHAIYALPMQSS